MDEFKPCPFCGGAVNWCGETGDDPHECHQIECQNCGLFDLSGEQKPDELRELRKICQDKFNQRRPVVLTP